MISDIVIALERAALDRWGSGDTQGYLDIMESDVTYFDPYQDRRVDGIEAMRQLLLPFMGKIKIDRYEILNPVVQGDEQVAVLSFNLVNYVRQPDGTETVLNRWNSTEMYRRCGDAWKIAHSHWSYVTPLAAPVQPDDKV